MAGTGPCFNCKDRHVACSDTCDTYKSWINRLKEIRKREKEDKNYYSYTKEKALKNKQMRSKRGRI